MFGWLNKNQNPVPQQSTQVDMADTPAEVANAASHDRMQQPAATPDLAVAPSAAPVSALPATHETTSPAATAGLATAPSAMQAPAAQPVPHTTAPMAVPVANLEAGTKPDMGSSSAFPVNQRSKQSPEVGALAIVANPPRYDVVKIVNIQAGGRRVIVDLGNGMRAYSRRKDGSYRLEDASDLSSAQLILDKSIEEIKMFERNNRSKPQRPKLSIVKSK